MQRVLTFLITSGPTREYIDPVRYLTNASSGKTGKYLAEAALKKGHKVIFVSGPGGALPEGSARVHNVVSARGMFRKTAANFSKADIVIGAAAVADYSPSRISRVKIKSGKDSASISLKKNTDILKYLGARKGKKVVAGFALETGSVNENARRKLIDKNLDFIVANGPENIGGEKANAAIIRRDRSRLNLKNVSKRILAARIIDETERVFYSNNNG